LQIIYDGEWRGDKHGGISSTQSVSCLAINLILEGGRRKINEEEKQQMFQLDFGFSLNNRTGNNPKYCFDLRRSNV
jgi:hypothetical protein